ncbi:hypothetical protein PR048_010842 [Dryococelus australis]|uniref:Uncharacterized protein n=1 Tax=Dryococelus australis TaxID=614101 RepID=A0ABQ9I3U6_9NEOP|nr:hypothetical protein PR048_010842 [Dryococelus australis]
MVRNRKRTTDRPIAAFTEDDMIAAVELVCAGRYVNKKKANPDTDVQMRLKYDCRRVFSDEEKGHLVMYLLECAMGWTPLKLTILHEIGTSTVQNTKKILAPKGVKQLNNVTSGEKGTHVTTCCIISASGVALPPAMVFPQVQFKEHMLKGAPPGTLGLAAQSAWMNNELFA